MNKTPPGSDPRKKLRLSQLMPTRWKVSPLHIRTSEEHLMVLYSVVGLILLVLWLVGTLSFVMVLAGGAAMAAHYYSQKIQHDEQSSFVVYSDQVPHIQMGKGMDESIRKARALLKRTQVTDPENWMLAWVHKDKVLTEAPLDWDDEDLKTYFNSNR